MTPATCRHCGRPFRPRSASLAQQPGTVKMSGRGLCSRDYRVELQDGERMFRRWVDIEDDIEVLLARTDPSGVAVALGMTRNAISRSARRNGHVDLARLFERVPTGGAR